MRASQQTITPELRRWIIDQAEAGCRPQDIVAAMCTSGWDEDVALTALEQTLAERLAQMRPKAAVAAAPPVGAAGAGAPASQALDTAGRADGACADSAQPARALPEPALADAPAVLDVEGHRVQVLLTMRHPRVVVFGQLFSDDECTQLMALAAPRLLRSETVDHATGGSEVNAARTSDGMFFERGEHPLIQKLERRIARLLHWPVENGEGLQILRYRPGAEYRPHHDYFDPAQPGTPRILERGGQRLATLVIYLNTPQGGGATTFPDVGLEVAPLRGNAVFFSYDRPHAGTLTLHGGAPVTAGEKWVATKWLRAGVFV